MFVTVLAYAGASVAQTANEPLPSTEPTAEESGLPQRLDNGLPALISADQVTYDEDLGLVTANGNVEISQGGRVLLADTVSYNLRSDVVTASGSVSLLEPTGHTVFAEFVEITGDLREGFIRDIRILMSDNSRIAAADGTRTAGDRTVFRRGVFSACELCREDPERAPLWQLKAQRIVHDQEDQMIRYSNAWMEIFGVPVLYTPYFEHPDPTVERKSGFLAPTFGNSESLGLVFQVPYYWTMGPDLDVTFEPIFTTKQSVVLAGEYRQLFRFGEHRFEGSGTIADRENDNGNTESNELRGHIEAQGIYELDRFWRAGFDINRASDDTYLRLYNFSNDAFLTSNVYVERLEGRNYFATNGYSFQGLREDDRNLQTPIIFPMWDFNYVSEPWYADSTFRFDANLMVLNRLEGRDTHRVSLISGWEMPFTDPIGGAYTLAARLQTDGYYTNSFDSDSSQVKPDTSTGSETGGRVFPQIALNWRYPWVSDSDVLSQVVEPVAQFVAGPNSGNPDDIPNEDSVDFVFDDTNLFSLNRFPGRDRIDPGQRVDYGLRWSGTTRKGGYASAFIGQSYRLTSEDDFAKNSGVEDEFSDVVGRIRLKPITDVDIAYRYRLSKDDLDPQQHELDVRIGPPALNLNLEYIFLNRESGSDDFKDREEVVGRLSTQINENWSAFFSTRRDLENDDTLRTSVGIGYSDECFAIELVGERRQFSDREIDPDNSVFVRVEFKHLGGVESSN